MIAAALAGSSKAAILSAERVGLERPNVIELARGSYVSKTIDQIRSSGYCIESLEAALWCFQHTNTFEAAVLSAVNLGDDADTTAAIVGQLAGAFYGVRGITQRWLERLYMRADIEMLADRFCRQRACTDIGEPRD
jgi:ADP-ribosyl-[dinitrogen reductase] hydrolase